MYLVILNDDKTVRKVIQDAPPDLDGVYVSEYPPQGLNLEVGKRYKLCYNESIGEFYKKEIEYYGTDN